ncbi:hypothetical protein FNV43_RR21251 [Rhamnella rubrinervis]|uniref:Uncharacterized protein n=1 Tax=Rhamnella rubrinervis TaxID=2594499 RepID=A0A8K0GU74_9ROSA|nr:hypothetical protein FNV43_RR21251 [Rhamnella rubrinervis]
MSGATVVGKRRAHRPSGLAWKCRANRTRAYLEARQGRARDLREELSLHGSEKAWLGHQSRATARTCLKSGRLGFQALSLIVKFGGRRRALDQVFALKPSKTYFQQPRQRHQPNERVNLASKIVAPERQEEEITPTQKDVARPSFTEGGTSMTDERVDQLLAQMEELVQSTRALQQWNEAQERINRQLLEAFNAVQNNSG